LTIYSLQLGFYIDPKEVGGKPHIERHARRQLESTATLALDGQVEILRTKNVRSVKATLAVQEVHVAILAALAHFVAPMPRIPDKH